MTPERAFRFTKAIVRTPAASVTRGLRDGPASNPDATLFARQHGVYVDALEHAGAHVISLPPLEQYPDSVFVEDTTICIKDTAILLRPGAPSRFGEREFIYPALKANFNKVVDITDVYHHDGFIDGGDVLLSDNHAFIGLSARTDQRGLNALASILKDHEYIPVQVETPSSILHFKTECGLLDSTTIFATRKLAALECFKGYHIIEVPAGEETAANIVRFNDTVFLSAGFPKSEALLRNAGYKVTTIDTSEPAKIDGGLSCMSLRF